MMLKKLNLFSQKDVDTLITHTNPHSIISEEFKTLRTNIQFAMANSPLQTLMVTSANEGEGKTTISANTAMSFAQQGKKVLLVDSDMRNPTLHKLFQVKNKSGLSNLLSDPYLSFSQVFQPTPHSNLTLLTSGPNPSNPAELMDSDQMNELIEKFKDEFQLIIFDMPPILPVSDSQIMAARVDGTVFVIRSGSTDKKDLLKAKELLQYAKATIIGAVLNDKKNKKLSKSDYYGYGVG
ncbi:CpsD/CapB family tyrosine-protein kinase [Jeotgalibaca sp. MA1X17-3]|uniref:CpsD/CapB family tyrosine-protein kinase n=1 Tax=Jeotgalibaca sp. MA1X17-3 TaxID=2908211 RepID=UPI0028833FE5|nr:CpsD/CapB family tyrosine-protein kinase [Jeotgalibaca sp. MA1X17-3]